MKLKKKTITGVVLGSKFISDKCKAQKIQIKKGGRQKVLILKVEGTLFNFNFFSDAFCSVVIQNAGGSGHRAFQPAGVE